MIKKYNMVDNIEQVLKLSNKYNIPTEDLILIDLNLSGINMELKSGRVRFELESTNPNLFKLGHSNNIKDYYLAIPTRKDSSYYFKRGNLVIDNKVIGKAHGVTEDYCDSSYPRRGGTVLNINPNARTSCRGCKFCYTAMQVARDKNCMLSEDKLRNYLIDLMRQYEVKDLSHLLQVAIVTGCFPTEQSVINFFIMAKRVLNEFSFNGELLYFGSQIMSKGALETLKGVKPLAICFSLECFDAPNREYFLRDIKREIKIEKIKEIMKIANDMGIRTTYSYIVGLESLDVIERGFTDFLSYINSFPIVNTFQCHKGQIILRSEEANKIEYYIKARKIIEKIYSQSKYRPRPWENYRSLWYLKFGNELLGDIRTPLPSPEHKMFKKIVACYD